MAKVTVPAEIGQQIQLARVKKNWSQTDLSNQLGWGAAGQTLVSRLERGATRTDEDKLTAILNLLELRLEAKESLKINSAKQSSNVDTSDIHLVESSQTKIKEFMNETRQLIDYMKQKTGFRFDREVATALGIDPTYLSHAIRLNRPPWPQIESTFPGWMDELKHFLELKRQDAKSAQEEPRTVGIPSDYREIPVYNVRVSAGHGELPGVEAIKQLVQMPRMFLPSNGQIGIVRVEGDSMFPTISHGDHVAVEFGSGYTSDGLYLIRIEDAAFVKRLQREFGQIRIISDNTLYREMVVHPEDEQQFSLIGRVALILRVT